MKLSLTLLFQALQTISIYYKLTLSFALAGSFFVINVYANRLYALSVNHLLGVLKRHVDPVVFALDAPLVVPLQDPSGQDAHDLLHEAGAEEAAVQLENFVNERRRALVPLLAQVVVIWFSLEAASKLLSYELGNCLLIG